MHLHSSYRECAVLLAGAVVLLLTLLLYRPRFLGIRWGGLLLWLGAWVAGALVVADRLGIFDGSGGQYRGTNGRDLQNVISSLCAGTLILFAVPFVVRLYGKWIGSSITESEKAPGAQGVRAWLCGWNLALAVAISLCAWRGFEYSFWGVLAMTLGLLLAYPAIGAMASAGKPAQAAGAAGADLSSERERVLKLLEEKKITAEEASELLGALTDPVSTPEPPAAMTAGKKLLLLGTLGVIVGFFLPWYSFDLGQEMSRVTRAVSDMSRNMGGPPMSPGGFSMQSPMPTQTPMQAIFSGTVRASGGDIDHGFGWIVLLLGVLAAVLPFVKLNVSPQAQRMLLAGPLAVGAFVIVYLLTRDIRHVSFGLPLVLAGYAVEFIGLMKDRRGPA